MTEALEGRLRSFEAALDDCLAARQAWTWVEDDTGADIETVEDFRDCAVILADLH